MNNMKNQFDHQQGEYLALQDASIYYETIGNKEKPALVLLHGGGQEMEMFNGLLPFFINHFYIIGIDTRGHGKSNIGKILNYKQIQQDVEFVIKTLNIEAVNLLGFSDGGVVAYKIAIEQNIKVKKLITIGASWHIQDSLDVENLMKSITGEYWKNKFPEMYQQYMVLNPDKEFDIFIKKLIDMWLDNTENGFPCEKVQQITCPTLLIRGDQDIFLTRESISKLAHLISGSQVCNIPFAGHAVYENQLDVIILVIKQFFKEEFS
jgi:pimeloyl-ACP methyl ester carboxylesterase